MNPTSSASAPTNRSLIAKLIVAVPLALLVSYAATAALRAVMIVAKILTSDRPIYGSQQLNDVIWPFMYLCLAGIISVFAFRSKSAAIALKMGGFLALASMATGGILIPLFCNLVRDPGGQGWRGLTNSIDEEQWLFSLLIGAGCLILSFVLRRATRLKGALSSQFPVISEAGPSTKCPFCAESVKAEAIVCKHCGRELPNSAAVGASR